jgi:hypothetical protein
VKQLKKTMILLEGGNVDNQHRKQQMMINWDTLHSNNSKRHKQQEVDMPGYAEIYQSSTSILQWSRQATSIQKSARSARMQLMLSVYYVMYPFIMCLNVAKLQVNNIFPMA